MNAEETRQHHVKAMSLAAAPATGMDVVIVATNNAQQEAYWQEKLAQSTGYSLPETTKIIVVQEDWPGGAGNALGTLYAFQKAWKKGLELYDIDLLDFQRNGASVAIYHTAGQGTRLAPLPGSERNNKSAVKLPNLKMDGEEPEFLTILEAVIRQTALFGEKRKGRLSVFWGDQIFIPSKQPTDSHALADILACVLPLPSREAWEAKGLSRYGLLAVSADGNAKQLEKVDYDTLQRLIDEGVVDASDSFGTSLGSFSLSTELLEALLAEFTPELTAKKGKLDSDPHWWMPLTLDEETYVSVMTSKGTPPDDAKRHFQRMQELKKRLIGDKATPLLGVIDVGQDSYWWDFGTVRAYYDNCLKLTKDSPEGEAIRSFFNGTPAKLSKPEDIDIDGNSVLIGCQIKHGKIRNSLLVGMKADTVDITDSVVMNSACEELSGERCLLYNVLENGILRLTPNTVRTDIQLPCGHLKMHTNIDRNGNADWKIQLEGNPVSYADLYQLNEEALCEPK